jgi:hypothetical protein
MVVPGRGFLGLGATRRFEGDSAQAEPSILAGLDGARGLSDLVTTGMASYNDALIHGVWCEAWCHEHWVIFPAGQTSEPARTTGGCPVRGRLP